MKTSTKQIRITPRDNQSLDLYLRDIASQPLLTVDEEVSLAQRIHAGDEKALEQLVLGNLRFVVTIAKNYVGCGLELPDLVSAGNIGLITAARRFDETYGVKFCSYAVHWIRQSIMTFLAKEGRLVKLPSNQIRFLSKFNNETARLEQELQRTPSKGEVTDQLGENETRCDWLLRTSEKPLSLDAPIQNGEDLARVETLTDSSAPKPDESLMRESLHDDIENILSTLSKTESKVLRMSFGIDHHRAYSMDEIAMRMNLSRERVRQIHNKAILRLKNNSSNDRLKDYLQSLRQHQPTA